MGGLPTGAPTPPAEPTCQSSSRWCMSFEGTRPASCGVAPPGDGVMDLTGTVSPRGLHGKRQLSDAEMALHQRPGPAENCPLGLPRAPDCGFSPDAPNTLGSVIRCRGRVWPCTEPSPSPWVSTPPARGYSSLPGCGMLHASKRDGLPGLGGHPGVASGLPLWRATPRAPGLTVVTGPGWGGVPVPPRGTWARPVRWA